MKFGIETKIYKYQSIVEKSNSKQEILKAGYCLSKNKSNSYIEGVIPSPWHGRSVALCKLNKKWIVIKGAGCPYLDYPFTNTPENDNRYWGLISKDECYREQFFMEKVNSLGIKSSSFLSINKLIGNFKTSIQPYNLFYSLENPLRIIDLDFLNNNEKENIKKKILNKSKYNEVHLHFIDIISDYLIILYSNGIMHNSLSIHNITLSMELVDFEASFEKETYGEKQFKKLVPREIVQLREIGFSLCYYFNEKYNKKEIQKIINSKKFKLFY